MRDNGKNTASAGRITFLIAQSRCTRLQGGVLRWSHDAREEIVVGRRRALWRGRMLLLRVWIVSTSTSGAGDGDGGVDCDSDGRAAAAGANICTQTRSSTPSVGVEAPAVARVDSEQTNAKGDAWW